MPEFAAKQCVYNNSDQTLQKTSKIDHQSLRLGSKPYFTSGDHVTDFNFAFLGLFFDSLIKNTQNVQLLAKSTKFLENSAKSYKELVKITLTLVVDFNSQFLTLLENLITANCVHIV